MSALIVAVISLIVASSGLALWIYGRFHLLQTRLELDAAQKRLQSLEQAHTGLSAAANDADRRLGNMERRLGNMEAREAQIEQLTARQEDLENQQEHDHPYAHAIRLVRQGASARRLIDELYLSESEANLIVRLHGTAHSA
jgi:hypothetical protein